MISNDRVKYLSSLKMKKFRKEENKFIIEGTRIVDEAIKSIFNINSKVPFSSKSNYSIENIWMTEKFLSDNNNKNIIIQIRNNFSLDIISEKDIKRISNVNNGQGIIALINYNIDNNNIEGGPILLLDSISNPGNLGTILRSAEWFGIKNIFISTNTTDPYGPKTIQSSMGAHFYIPSIIQTNLIKVINKYKNEGYSIIGTSLNGISIDDVKINNKWILILGNEAHGLSEEINKYVDCHITINKLGNMDSLNVAMAGSIILSKLMN